MSSAIIYILIITGTSSGNFYPVTTQEFFDIDRCKSAAHILMNHSRQIKAFCVQK